MRSASATSWSATPPTTRSRRRRAPTSTSASPAGSNGTATLVEQDEIVGYHLEQAYRNRAELDSTDARLRRSGAVRRSGSSPPGRGALTRGDLGAARGLLGRAAAMLPVGDGQRLRILVDLVPALTQAGELDASRDIAAELHASPDPRYQAFGEIMASMVDFFAGTYRRDDTQARIAAARAVFNDVDEPLGLGYADWIESAMSWSAMRAEETGEAALRGVEHAQRAGAAWLEEVMIRWTNYPLSFGPTPVAEALRVTELELSQAGLTLLSLGVARRRYARLLAMQGAFERAREQLRLGAAISRSRRRLPRRSRRGRGDDVGQHRGAGRRPRRRRAGGARRCGGARPAGRPRLLRDRRARPRRDPAAAGDATRRPRARCVSCARRRARTTSPNITGADAQSREFFSRGAVSWRRANALRARPPS